MRIVGLTGGIASGKSTVRAMLRELGACVLDADAIYHELIAPDGTTPSPLARAVGERFPGVLKSDGTLDRQKLGQRVFDAPLERRDLEELTHPAVARRVAQRVAELEADGVRLVIYDVPLLYERGLERGMHGVIVVWVPREVQLERLRRRDGLSAATATQRLAAQLPLDDKRARATWVIDNSGALSTTQRDVGALWLQLTEGLTGS